MYGKLSHSREFFAGQPAINPTQPPTCPLQSISVTTDNNQITLQATAKGATTPEAPHVFVGNDRYQQYGQFWTSLGSSLNNFDQCIDPLKDDPQRQSGANANSLPTNSPQAPSATPSGSPSATPSGSPSATPSGSPSTAPSGSPSASASASPSASAPTSPPSVTPSSSPDALPTPSTDFDLSLSDTSNSFGDLSGDISSDVSSLESFNWGSIFKYLLKVIILFGLIFLFSTVIPKQSLELMTRLLIAAVVVICYIMLDVVRHGLVKLKKWICSASCGC